VLLEVLAKRQGARNAKRPQASSPQADLSTLTKTNYSRDLCMKQLLFSYFFLLLKQSNSVIGWFGNMKLQNCRAFPVNNGE
jgi:hypothetical protein